MAIWYRVAKTEHMDNIFSGDGGLYVAGRWNHKGRKIIYCSQSISLCTLEWLSHNGLSVSEFSFYRFSIEIPTELIKPLTLSELPNEWTATPATNTTRDFAEKQLFNNTRYLALAIPSVMVPEELNLIINPLHPSFSQVTNSITALGKHIAPKRC